MAVMTVGMFAGVFGLYSNAIMPGLRRTDDRTFVGAFQAIDTAVINPLFLSTCSAASCSLVAEQTQVDGGVHGKGMTGR
jgi:uncharacterized membrane protein